MRGSTPHVSLRRPTLGRWALALLVAVALALPTAAGADEQLLRIELRPTDYDATSHYLNDVVKADIAGFRPDEGTIEVIATEGDLPTLWLLGEVTILERSRPFREVQAERHDRGIDAPEEGYRDYDEILAWMDDQVAFNPSIAMKVNLTQMLGTPQTHEGRDVYALKISDNVTEDEDELTFLVDGNHHARELNSIEMAIDVGTALVEVYTNGTAPLATTIVDNTEVWIVPSVNPDGLEYVWSTNQFWRKNRRNNGGGSFGVDPNRNYTFGWGVCGSNSGNPSSETYRGPSAASEPETQTIIALGELIRPTIYLTYHSFGREVLPPYRCFNLAEAPMIAGMRDVYRNRMSYAFRPASSSGESFEHFYNQISSVGFLTEVGDNFQPPYAETRAEVRRVRPGWIFLLESMLGGLNSGPIVQGNVTEAGTGLPIEAEVSSTAINFTEGERRASEAGFGLYSWFLPQGQQMLTFSAPGYQSATVPVNNTAGGVTVDVQLSPNP